MTRSEIEGVVMAALFVAGEAVETCVFAEITGTDPDEMDIIVQEMIAEQELRESGVLMMRLGSKVQLCTNKKYAEILKELFAPQVRESLTDSMLETLSIIAYRQPVTRPEIDDIRGVHSNYSVAALAEKGLVKEIGKKDVLGRPALFTTTDEFLRHFGISSLKELPSIDFEAVARGEFPPEEDPADREGEL